MDVKSSKIIYNISNEEELIMEKRIVELTKESNGYQCLLCCERDATIKVQIQRVKYNDSVISFEVCDTCLARMQQDIQKICE